MALLGDFLSGGVGAYGYNELMDRMSDQRSDMQGALGDLQQGVDDRTSFQPWSIKGPAGRSSQNADGSMHSQLNSGMQGIQDNMFGMGQDMLGRASQDPAQREQEIYERMRATQSPEEQRAQQQLQAQMAAQGKGGMRTAMYGGSPEQLAMYKAIEEGKHNSMMGAMGQAQNELTNQYTMGSGMMGQGYQPMEHLLQQQQLGMQGNQNYQNAQMNNANLWTQLGLGGITADTNYGNMEGNAFGNMISAIMPFAGSAGNAISDSNFGQAAGDWFTGLFS